MTFEHENEAHDLLNKKENHYVFADILGEKEIKVPYFLTFDTLNDYCKGKLKDKLFSINNLGNLDLIQLKNLIL